MRLSAKNKKNCIDVSNTLLNRKEIEQYLKRP